MFLSKQARSHLVNSIIKFEFLPYPPQCTMPLHSLGISRHIKTKSTVASRHQKEMTKNQRKFPSNAITIAALLQSVKRIYHTFAINLVSVVLHWFMHADSVIWYEGVSADSDYLFSFIFKKRKLLCCCCTAHSANIAAECQLHGLLAKPFLVNCMRFFLELVYVYCSF